MRMDDVGPKFVDVDASVQFLPSADLTSDVSNGHTWTVLAQSTSAGWPNGVPSLTITHVPSTLSLADVRARLRCACLCVGIASQRLPCASCVVQLAAVLSARQRGAAYSPTSGASRTVTAPRSTATDGAQLSIDLAALSGSSRGLYLRRSSDNQYSSSSSLVSFSNLCGSFVSRSGQKAVFWVTYCDTGAAVAGVKIMPFAIYYDSATSLGDAAGGTTNSDGVALLTVPVGPNTVTVVAYDASTGDMTAWEGLPAPVPMPSVLETGVLSTDRAVYKPGDTMHVFGYVREVDTVNQRVRVPTAYVGDEFGRTISIVWESNSWTPTVR